MVLDYCEFGPSILALKSEALEEADLAARAGSKKFLRTILAISKDFRAGR